MKNKKVSKMVLQKKFNWISGNNVPLFCQFLPYSLKHDTIIICIKIYKREYEGKEVQGTTFKMNTYMIKAKSQTKILILNVKDECDSQNR